MEMEATHKIWARKLKESLPETSRPRHDNIKMDLTNTGCVSEMD